MSLAQIIAENPTWPAIPGEGPWAGLPPDLRPLFEQMEDQIYIGSLTWWINLVVIGIIGYNVLWSFPSDVKLVWWPEIRRCLLQTTAPTHPRADDGGVAIGPYTTSKHNLRPPSTWKLPRPIICCHFFARLIAIPYIGAVVNYYRNPVSCNGAMHSTLMLIGLASVNGQMILTLRCQAITRDMAGHRILWLLLWAINLFELVCWSIFAFTTNIPTSFPVPWPMGFRIGFRCGPATDIKWIGITLYTISFAQDTLIFFVSVLAAGGSNNVTLGRSGSQHTANFFKTLRSGMQSAGRRMIASPDSPSPASNVSQTFIIDSIRAVLMSWLLEVVGAGFNIAYTLVRHSPDTVRTSWVLPLHVVISMVVCPALLNSSRSMAYVGSTREDYTWGIQSARPRSKDPLQGILIQSTVQHHTEKLDDPVLANSVTGQQAFRSYNLPLVVEDIHAISMTELKPNRSDSHGEDAKDDDQEYITATVLSPAVPNLSHNSESSGQGAYTHHGRTVSASTGDLPGPHP